MMITTLFSEINTPWFKNHEIKTRPAQQLVEAMRNNPVAFFEHYCVRQLNASFGVEWLSATYLSPHHSPSGNKLKLSDQVAHANPELAALLMSLGKTKNAPLITSLREVLADRGFGKIEASSDAHPDRFNAAAAQCALSLLELAACGQLTPLITNDGAWTSTSTHEAGARELHSPALGGVFSLGTSRITRAFGASHGWTFDLKSADITIASNVYGIKLSSSDPYSDRAKTHHITRAEAKIQINQSLYDPSRNAVLSDLGWATADIEHHRKDKTNGQQPKLLSGYLANSDRDAYGDSAAAHRIQEMTTLAVKIGGMRATEQLRLMYPEHGVELVGFLHDDCRICVAPPVPLTNELRDDFLRVVTRYVNLAHEALVRAYRQQHGLDLLRPIPNKLVIEATDTSRSIEAQVLDNWDVKPVTDTRVKSNYLPPEAFKLTGKAQTHRAIWGTPGCGKTTAMISYARQNNLRVLYVCSRVEVLRQTAFKFSPDRAVAADVFDEAGKKKYEAGVQMLAITPQRLMTGNQQNFLSPFLLDKTPFIFVFDEVETIARDFDSLDADHQLYFTDNITSIRKASGCQGVFLLDAIEYPAVIRLAEKLSISTADTYRFHKTDALKISIKSPQAVIEEIKSAENPFVACYRVRDALIMAAEMGMEAFSRSTRRISDLSTTARAAYTQTASTGVSFDAVDGVARGQQFGLFDSATHPADLLQGVARVRSARDAVICYSRHMADFEQHEPAGERQRAESLDEVRGSAVQRQMTLCMLREAGYEVTDASGSLDGALTKTLNIICQKSMNANRAELNEANALLPRYIRQHLGSCEKRIDVRKLVYAQIKDESFVLDFLPDEYKSTRTARKSIDRGLFKLKSDEDARRALERAYRVAAYLLVLADEWANTRRNELVARYKTGGDEALMLAPEQLDLMCEKFKTNQTQLGNECRHRAAPETRKELYTRLFIRAVDRAFKSLLAGEQKRSMSRAEFMSAVREAIVHEAGGDALQLVRVLIAKQVNMLGADGKPALNAYGKPWRRNTEVDDLVLIPSLFQSVKKAVGEIERDLRGEQQGDLFAATQWLYSVNWRAGKLNDRVEIKMTEVTRELKPSAVDVAPVQVAPAVTQMSPVKRAMRTQVAKLAELRKQIMASSAQ